MATSIDAIRSLIDRHGGDGRTVTGLPGLTLFRTLAPKPPMSTIYRPTLCVVAQGRKQVVLGERVFDYDASKYLIVTVDLPVTGCIVEASAGSPFLGLTLDLDPARIADLLIDLPLTRPKPSGQQGALATSTLDEALLAPLARLVGLLERPDDAFVLRPMLEREIYFRLLLGDQGALLRQVATAGSHLAQIGQAADWIRLHYADAIKVEELAAIVAMSVTSFHRHFKAITRMSPLQYRTQIRLQEARRLLLIDEQNAGAVGFAVGYESASQFAREYRRMFGTPPSADAAHLRARAARTTSPPSP